MVPKVVGQVWKQSQCLMILHTSLMQKNEPIWDTYFKKREFTIIMMGCVFVLKKSCKSTKSIVSKVFVEASLFDWVVPPQCVRWRQ